MSYEKPKDCSAYRVENQKNFDHSASAGRSRDELLMSASGLQEILARITDTRMTADKEIITDRDRTRQELEVFCACLGKLIEDSLSYVPISARPSWQRNKRLVDNLLTKAALVVNNREYFLRLIQDLRDDIINKDQIESWELGKQELISEINAFLNSEMSDFMIAAERGLDYMQECMRFLSEESRDFLSARIISLRGLAMLAMQIETQKIDKVIQAIHAHLQEIIRVLGGDDT